METGYKSVFGPVRVARTGYSHRGVASLFPRDAELNLPARGYSHRLQKRVAAKAVKMSFEEVVTDIETETGVRLGKAQVEQIVYGAAQDFDAFYTQPCSAEVQQHAQAKPIQVLSFDGKGVVMRTEALRDATRKKAEARAQKLPRGFARKEKSNRKRMATVASIYHIDRHPRSVQTVARQFAPLRLVPHPKPAAPKPVGKKLWASLKKPMKTVIETGFAEGLRRDPDHQERGDHCRHHSRVGISLESRQSPVRPRGPSCRPVGRGPDRTPVARTGERHREQLTSLVELEELEEEPTQAD